MKRLLIIGLALLLTIRASATEYNITDGEDLQTKLNLPPACGDILTLTAGSSYSRTDPAAEFTVQNSMPDCSANPVIIRSSAIGSITLPSGSTKTERDAWVTSNAANFAKIVTGRQEALKVEAGVKGVTFQGIEFTTNGNTSYYTADIVAVAVYGSGPGGYSTSAEKLATTDIMFDRVFIHPAEMSGVLPLYSLVNHRTSGRGIHWAGVDLTFKNSDCRGFGGMFYPTGIGTIATAPTPATTGTTIVLQSGHGATLAAAGGTTPFSAQIWDGTTTPTEANSELVSVTNISTDTVTIVRNVPDNNVLEPVARSVVVGDKIGYHTVVDAYCVYNDSPPSSAMLIDNNYLEAHTMTVFTGGGTAQYASSATLSAGATSTQGTFSTVAGLTVGEFIAVQVPSFTSPCAGHSAIHKVAKVTNIAGNVVTYSGPDAGGCSPLNETPNIPGEVVWDGYNVETVTVTDNLFYKLDQVGGKKGHLEFKSCINCLVESNVSDGEWPSDFALTPHNQDGKQPWTQVSNTTVRYNKFYNDSRLFTAQMTDPEYTSVRSSTLLVEHNLRVGGCDDAHTMSIYAMGGDTVTYRHNTSIEDCSASTNSILFTTDDLIGLTLQDNIFWTGNYVLNCQVSPYTPDTCWPSKVQTNNVLVNTTGTSDGTVAANYPNDFVASNTAAVQFLNSAAGNWGLASGSPYKAGGTNDASDGTDVGVNCALLPGSDCALPVSGGGSGAAHRGRARGRFR